MNCQEVRERLPALIDEELAPEERAEVEKHLEGCEDCRAEKHRQEQFTTRVKTSLEDLRPSELFVKGVLDKLEDPARKKQAERETIRRTKISLAAAGVVIAVVLLAALLLALTRRPTRYAGEVTGCTQGKAWLEPGGKEGLLPIPLHLPQDARIRTDQGGKVVISLTGGGELTLQEKSLLRIGVAAGKALPELHSGAITLAVPAGLSVRVRAGEVTVKAAAESEVQVSLQYGSTVVVKVTSGSARIAGAGPDEVEALPGQLWRAASDGSGRPENIETRSEP
jgi:ferric-dicitrate binding protein FerR (iron transport regulator)